MDTGCSEKGTRHPTHTGWDFPRFHCLHGKFTWRDWPWRQPFTKKKGWHWDARWNSQPVALCDEGAFQHYHTAFRLERVFQLGLWCFSASCFSTQWDLKILKCSRMDSAWNVPDRTDTKKAPFNYNIQYFLDWILHGFMSCKLNLQLKQILKFLFNIPGVGDIQWLDKWYSWHFELGLFFSPSQHSNF